MKILFITHYFAPDSGAAANRLTRLATMLQARGHDITVLTTMPHYPSGKIPDDYRRHWQVIEDRDGMRVIQVWLWTSTSPKILMRLISQLSFMLMCMVRGIFLQKPDVIFIENQPIFTGLAGWFISKIKRTPYVLNVSDYWPEYLVVAGVVKETGIIYRVFKSLANLTQRSAGAITAMLDDLLLKIQNRIGTIENGYVIRNSVDLSLYNHPELNQSFREKNSLNKNRLVTFLGGLGPHIDMDTMLDVAKQLSSYNDVTVLFVGSGAQKDKLTDALSQAEFSHCHHIDWIGAEDVPGFWEASYLTFWALHHNELDKMRFQAKLYEALASGTPSVIAVDGLMSEFLAHTKTGLTVLPGDVDAMVAAIQQLLEDSNAYQSMSKRGRDYAAEHFDAEIQVSAYEGVLENVANS